MKYNLKQLVSYINNSNNSNIYIINIGCGDGITQDPLNIFVNNKNYKGLYIDGDSIKCQKCKSNISKNFTVLNCILTPDNVISIFEENNVPKNIDILKVDIDGYDLALIREILKGQYEPAIIISEINEKIPPPIKFEIIYKKSYNWATDHFFGYSIATGKEFFEANNYYIVSLYDMNNILCVKKNYIPLIPQLVSTILPLNINNLYQEGYVKYKSNFPWNNDVNSWLFISDREVLKNKIIDYYGAGTNRNQKRKYILNDDYIIE